MTRSKQTHRKYDSNKNRKGKLIQTSKIDGRPVRMIYASELNKLNIGDFELIHSHDDVNSMREAQTIILNKLMNWRKLT